MGCNCGGTSSVKYRVTFKDQSTQDYDTIGEAQSAITASGAAPGEATFRAVSV